VIHVGIDPGLRGAAVVLDGDRRQVLFAMAWRETRAGFEVAYSSGLLATARTLAGVAELLRREVEDNQPAEFTLSVEGLFVRTGKANGMLRLAEAAALVYGPLLEDAVAFERPLASTWRPAILGLSSSTTADQADAAALRLAPHRFDGLGELRSNPHACEAACIAAYGAMVYARGGRPSRSRTRSPTT